MDLVKGAEFFNRKPPVHFHMQEEYIESTQGNLGLEIEGKELVLKPEDGRFDIKPYMNHRSYPIELARQDDGNTVVKFLLSGAKTNSTFELNPLFFENWYKYQDEIVVNGASIDLIQVFCVSEPHFRLLAAPRGRESKLTHRSQMFDAGGTYLSFPWWVPFGQSISIALGVVVGRWIGSGLLGYQPFYRKWSSDWEMACKMMESNIFQRRFAVRTKDD